MKLLDCTLRDGGNVVGKGFDNKLTVMMIEGLIEANIKTIEMGNCLGIGAYDANDSIAPLNDVEYLDLVQPYLDKAEIGMFIGVMNANKENITLGHKKGLHFLRIGANAGDGKLAEDAIRLMKEIGIKSRYAMMKGYILSPQELAQEAKMLESFGLDEITIMDSAGTMVPSQVREYVSEMCKAVSIPVGFHGHNNMGLSVANAIAAYESGAASLDCGLMGMARSAGNLSTETAVATFKRLGLFEDIDFYKLLNFIELKLEPAMEEYNFTNPIKPIDVIYGYAGCHSSFGGLFKSVAEKKEVGLYPLIVEVSKIDRKAPSLELIEQVAEKIKSKNM